MALGPKETAADKPDAQVMPGCLPVAAEAIELSAISTASTQTEQNYIVKDVGWALPTEMNTVEVAGPQVGSATLRCVKPLF